MRVICEKCGRELKSEYGYSRHIRSCDGDPTPYYKRRKYGTHKDQGDWQRGKTFAERFGESKALQIRSTISKKHVNSWDQMNEEQRNSQREKCRRAIQQRYDAGWMPKAGRSQKYPFRDFTVDGTWELIFCEWADRLEVSFDRNRDRFRYEYAGKLRWYTPDFKLDETTYVEVKGYETEKDRKKWNAFPHTLIVLKQDQIKRMKENRFLPLDLKKCIILEGGQDGNAADC